MLSLMKNHPFWSIFVLSIIFIFLGFCSVFGLGISLLLVGLILLISVGIIGWNNIPEQE